MATIPSSPTWSDDVYQIETTDAVLGGPDGVINVQAKQLADRTEYLKQEVEAAGTVADGADTKADSALAQIAGIETAAGSAQANAAEALLHKQAAQAAQALAEQARNAAQAAQGQASDNAGFAYQAAQTAQLKASEAQSGATAAVSAAGTALAHRTAAEAARNQAQAAQADSEAARDAASSARTDAEAAASSAAASLDSFDDRYLGAKTSNPTTDNDGQALMDGAMYWNILAAEMRVWNGFSWQVYGANSANISHMPAGTGAVATTVQRKLQEKSSINDLNEDVANGVIDSSAVAQAVAALCDSEKKRYLYIPNWGGTFKWVSPVVFTNPGVRIFGDQSATYNRGSGKEGWLIGQAGLTRFFDLGAYRTTGNPADQWQVDGISMKQAVGVATRTIDGIGFTSRTNGPDRGANIRDVSFIGLKDAITVENPDVSVTLASLNVEGCVFQGCDSAVNAKGRVFGLRFVNNQCEQNIGTNGVIRGYIDGNINISDNMMEGQPNPISIDIPPTFGNQPRMRSEGNYFELNSGKYVYRLRVSTSISAFKIGPNYAININSDDYILVQDSSGATLLDVYDDYPVCFDNSSVSLKYGSNILRNRIRGYRVRKVSATKPSEVIISDYVNLTDKDGDHAHGFPSTGTVMQTPNGKMICATGASFVTVPMSVSAGDMVAINMLCQAEAVAAGNLSIQVYDQTTTVKVAEWGSSLVAAESAGKWVLVSAAFIATQPATSIRVRMLPVSGIYTTAVSGVSAKNLGAHTNDGTVYKTVTPVMPNVQNIETTLTVDLPSIAIGAGYTQTVTCPGANVGDFVVASLPTDLADVQVTAWVSAANTVKVRFQNQSTVGPRDFASMSLRVRVIR